MNKTESIDIYLRPTVEEIEKEITRRENKRELRATVLGAIKNIIVIAAAAVLISNLLISVLVVNRGSMNPTLNDGEVIITSRLSGIERQDVVAFYYNNKILVKRVIAKAGDWINITSDGAVYINNEILNEPYLTQQSLGECDIDFPYQVPDGTVFVMGDNRAFSADSRLNEIGPVKSEDIVGKVFMRIWPLQNIKFF